MASIHGVIVLPYGAEVVLKVPLDSMLHYTSTLSAIHVNGILECEEIFRQHMH